MKHDALTKDINWGLDVKREQMDSLVEQIEENISHIADLTDKWSMEKDLALKIEKLEREFDACATKIQS